MQKLFVGSIVLGVCVLLWSAGGFGQEVPTPRGELRIVDKNPLNWEENTRLRQPHLDLGRI
jgi:hypothetical protein